MRQTAALLILASSCLAGTTDDSVPDAKYLERGQAYAPFVRRIYVSSPDTPRGGRPSEATAVVIAPRWALTAAHVVDTAAMADVAGNRVLCVFLHPRFEAELTGHHYDIAALWCAEEFGLDYYPPYASQHAKPGDLVTVAGYGSTGRISTGHTRYDALLRAGTQRIDRIEGSRMVCVISRGGSPMEYGIAPGDSGGPVYLGSGPTATLVGINSTVQRGKSNSESLPASAREGNESRHTNVSLVDEWLDEVMGMVK